MSISSHYGGFAPAQWHQAATKWQVARQSDVPSPSFGVTTDGSLEVWHRPAASKFEPGQRCQEMFSGCAPLLSPPPPPPNAADNHALPARNEIQRGAVVSCACTLVSPRAHPRCVLPTVHRDPFTKAAWGLPEGRVGANPRRRKLPSADRPRRLWETSAEFSSDGACSVRRCAFSPAIKAEACVAQKGMLSAGEAF